MKIHEILNILEKNLGNIEFHLLGTEENFEIDSLLTDSRNYFVADSTLFIAIKTEGGNDGHRYMNELYNKGVKNFIVQYIPENFSGKDDCNLILVPDSIKALSVIGASKRENAKEIVAITGSRGKTTLKEMIFQLMESFMSISRSPRSFNSKIGVPLSLWQISSGSDIALIEAGISQKGEMTNLSQIINPDIVIFTNIGDAHSTGFNSYEDKALEKSILANANNVKTVIFPEDDKYLSFLLHENIKNKELLTWSFKNPEASLYVNFEDGIFYYTWKGLKFRLHYQIEKDFEAENVVAALLFMLSQGFKPDVIQQQFNKLKKISTRLNVTEGVNRCSVIQDSYTSDFSSLIPALDFMRRRKMPFQNQTLILSDLQHEGISIQDTYKAIAGIIADYGISKFIGIGNNFMKYAHLFPRHANFFKDTASFLVNTKASDFNDEIVLMKGSAEYDFDKIRELLEIKKHETVLEVNLDALLRNYNYFKSFLPASTGIIAMVKASGYGSGSYEIAKTLQDAGATYLAVAALDEGIDLRSNGIILPIMVMNPRSANYRSLFKNRLEPVVYSFSMLQSLMDEAHLYVDDNYPIHIKLDTGMHRMGFMEDEMDSLIHLLSNSSHIKVASIFSHLATADCIDMDDFTLQQIQRFERMSSKIIEALNYPVKRHILNSAGIVRFSQYHFDMARLGIGLYGVNTLPPDIENPLSPVSSLRSVIICIREIETPESVGYGRKGRIQGKRKIATLPIGYADGMNRKFGNGAIKVMVNNHFAPTIGNICMDATMIDVTDIPCSEGDEVEIFGENINIQSLADTLDTIPYEVLTAVSPRVKRVYFRE